MRFLSMWLSTFVLVGSMGLSQTSTTYGSIPGNTTAMVNLRSGPGTSHGVIAVLDSQTPVTFDGRNANNTWFHLVVDENSLSGWISYRFANVDGSVLDLPIIAETAAEPGQPSVQTSESMKDMGTNLVPVISRRVREIFLTGQQLGNRAEVFSKVGDSITASDRFLDPIGHGGLILADYEHLRPVVEFFSNTPARDHNSFANTSLAARSGWTSSDVLDPRNAPSGCGPEESPLVCEYRATRPSVALIMFGTNDVGYVGSDQFRDNLNRIVQTSIDMGVIPILSTIPDQFGNYGSGRVNEFNTIIRSVAVANRIPLWDYWLALQPLPNQGISSDGIHPSYDSAWGETAVFTPEGLRYGYNVRNLTALMILDAIWHTAID